MHSARFPAGEAPDAEMSPPKVSLVPGEASDQGAGEKFPVKVQVALVAPSREEYERHIVTHYPYRSWCRHCVFGAGRRHKHVRVQATEHDKPVISIDYGFLPTGSDQTTDGGEEAGSSPFLVCADSDKKALLAEFVPSKGEDPYAVKVLTEHLLWFRSHRISVHGGR